MTRCFGIDRRTPSRLRLAQLRARLRQVARRLEAVRIEQMPYADVIRRYDGPETLFYLDPPYWACETDYGEGVFERADFERLADQLAGIRGRLVLSINDTPGVREVFDRFAIEAVPVTYTIGAASAGAGCRTGELIVRSV